MSDLIFFFDGGGKWAAEFAIILMICVLAIWLCLDKRSPMWEDEEDDEGDERP